MMLPPKFVQDPGVYLAEVASMATSRYTLKYLAGPVAGWFVATNNNNNGPESSSTEAAAAVVVDDVTLQQQGVASVYLQAAAVHLKDTEVKVGDVEEEMTRTRQQYEVLEAVGAAANKAPRSGISSSEILPTLAQLMMTQPNHLQQASVEFLQCALLAEHYRYAERLIRGTWPRPNSTVSVKQVLRYYFLRGMIHLGCDDAVMAHRCFWTCLTIPAEVNSKIQIEAWKKVVLVQCLLEDSVTSTSTRLPKVMPNALGRLLASYKDASKLPAKGKDKHFGDDHEPRPTKLKQQSQQQRESEESIESVTCYMDIAAALYKREKSTLEALKLQHDAILESDGNTGLIEQVQTRLTRNQIYHMANIYAAIPVSKCAATLQIPEAQVPSELRKSQIVCEIVDDDNMVVFGEQPTPAPSSVDMSEWMQLLEKVQRLDVGITTSTKYHSLIRKDVIPDAAAERAQGPRGVDEF